jgi:hypothetical protein
VSFSVERAAARAISKSKRATPDRIRTLLLVLAEMEPLLSRAREIVRKYEAITQRPKRSSARFSPAYGYRVRGMTNFFECFVREADGAWRCTTPIDLHLPEGRVQVAPGTVFIRGSRFMNIDLAKLLDDQHPIRQMRTA